jgi:hypothetical protein
MKLLSFSRFFRLDPRLITRLGQQSASGFLRRLPRAEPSAG